MTPDDFIEKWTASTRNEQAAAKEHFIDLCGLLGVPTPGSDATGKDYAFEKGATKTTGGRGWADVWRRDCFGWEYKSKGGDLEKAHDQLLRYAGALGNPPLLIVSDMDRMTVRTAFQGHVSARTDWKLEDLRRPVVRNKLKACWENPDLWKPAKTRQALTEEAAAEFAELAQRLRDKGHAPEVVGHFVIRLIFCLFADATKLLPDDLLRRMIDRALKVPKSFQTAASELFRAMAVKGGRVGYDDVAWFNGGLFNDDVALPLDSPDVKLLNRMSALDWSEIDPAIMGTLFERGLDESKRTQLGAHYTDRTKIGILVDEVVRKPLAAEWEAACGRIRSAMYARAGLVATAELVGAMSGAGAPAKSKVPGKKTALAAADAARADGLLAEAQEEYGSFLERLRTFRVLDPACGSGNFLYMSLLSLKDLELQADVDAEACGLDPIDPGVGPEVVLGIEKDPYAAELARVSVWIGHIQWARRNGYAPPSNPVLRPLSNIECRDSVLADDGTEPLWPKADVIIGNPPFLGSRKLRGALGADYCRKLFAAWAGRVSTEADLVCYWFTKANGAVLAGDAERAGLVATNSIRGGQNRKVLDTIAGTGAITSAWSDEPWTLDGAAVRVSLVCWGRGKALSPVLDGQAVPTIHADLTAGASNLTATRKLAENAGVSFQGSKKVGPFEVPGETARRWLALPGNANGRTNADVLRPSWVGIDVARRPRDMWIIDFTGMTEEEAAFYSAPYTHVVLHVKPLRDGNARDTRRTRWWLHGDAQPKMRKAIAPLDRCIVTPEVSKHRVFVWLPRPVLPDCQLMVTARDDDTTFGILHSRFHEVWSLRKGTSLEDRPRYTPSSTFETFPFPEGMAPTVPPSEYASDAKAQRIAEAARALVTARERWLDPPQIVSFSPDVLPGLPPRRNPKGTPAARELAKRTMTALYNLRGRPDGVWLDTLHRKLDEVVADAYGWPSAITDDEAMARLLALNAARPEAKKAKPDDDRDA
jgi:hypothetical protein